MAVIDVSATMRTVSNKNSKLQLVITSNVKFRVKVRDDKK